VDNPLWERLPLATRDRIDALIRTGSRIQAIATARRSDVVPEPLLHDCQELVAWRQQRLGSSEHRPTPNVADLVAELDCLPWSPDAIEAIWDGDTEGWFVVLTAVSVRERTEEALAVLRLGGDIRLLQGRVPPWPEAEQASVLGAAVASHFGIPFHFPSPDEPNDEASRLWDD
jgi:hypothetical protein